MNERELIQQLRDTIANDCAPYMGHTGVVVQALRAADAYLAAPVAPADYPECSGDPNCCPENEGFGCCKAPAEQSHAVSYMEGISDGRAEAAPALVPLTSEQITKAWHDAEGTRNGYGPFARAIEASHGIKP